MVQRYETLSRRTIRLSPNSYPEGTLSCPDRNLAVFHHYRHYEGLRLLPSVYDSKLIQQTLTNICLIFAAWMKKREQVELFGPIKSKPAWSNSKSARKGK